MTGDYGEKFGKVPLT
jgi:hypothetical protein